MNGTSLDLLSSDEDHPMIKLTLESLRRLRLQAQGLNTESLFNDVAQVTRNASGLQSQELPAATLAVRARTGGLTAEDVRHAREVSRSIVLTWTMRGTMHLVAAEDVGWQLRLFGALFIHKRERRYRQLGLDDATRRNAAHLIRNVLGNRGPLNRAELAQVLDKHGIPIEGQAIAHLVGYAALEGIICFGPERHGKPTYVLMEDWVNTEDDRAFSERQLVAELTRRYLRAYGPAAPSDMVSWSGLTAGQIRAGFEAISNDLVEVEIPDGTAWMLKDQAEYSEHVSMERNVRLLPRYDNYLLGYQSRDFMVQESFAKEVHPGGGLIRSVVIVNGQVIAVWQLEQKRGTAIITVQPFEPIDATLTPYLEAEVRDIGRFLQTEVLLSIVVPQ